jgi:hypothetical protein
LIPGSKDCQAIRQAAARGPCPIAAASGWGHDAQHLQLRRTLPQAYVHALAIEAAARLAI